MKAIVRHPDGREEEIKFPGENMALGLAAVKHTCVCGASEFVDGGPPGGPDEREPDRKCPCGRLYWYSEDDDEQTGYLH